MNKEVEQEVCTCFKPKQCQHKTMLSSSIPVKCTYKKSPPSKNRKKTFCNNGDCPSLCDQISALPFHRDERFVGGLITRSDLTLRW